jgi:hypothetical protein
MGIDLKVVQALLCYLAWALTDVGYPGQALQSALEAVARAGALSHPHTTAFAKGYIAILRWLRGNRTRPLRSLNSYSPRSLSMGRLIFSPPHFGIRGTVLAARGHEEGIPLIEQMVASGDVRPD